MQVGYEYKFIEDEEQLLWMQERIENKNLRQFTADEKRTIMDRLLKAHGFGQSSNLFCGWLDCDSVTESLPLLAVLAQRRLSRKSMAPKSALEWMAAKSLSQA